MVDAYDFNNISDLRNFISNILDGYCPYQLEKIDSDLVYDAIHSLKDDKIELSGNLIFIDAIERGVAKADEKIINWKDYIDEDELSDEQIETLDIFANKIKEDSGLINSGIIDYFANGSLDSSVYWVSSISDDDKKALNILINYSDIFNDLSQDIPLDLDALNIDYKTVFERDITDEMY